MSLAKSITLTVFAALTLHFASPAKAQTEASRELPLVWVLSTGGTISGQGATSTSLAEYKSGALLGEQLVAGVPEIKQVASVQVEQIVNVSSTDVTIANW
jgi:L-asparaginase/Glu-tRNA(Gln) amidotransferase subunit D